MKNIYLSWLLLFGLVSCYSGDDSSQQPLVYPEAESDAAQLYIAKCSECHAAPLPGIHISSHWPGIVQRMQQRMTAKAIQPLNRMDVATIVEYLQKHARDKKN